MFNFKNLSPNRLSVMTALVLGFAVGIAFFGLTWSWVYALVAGFVFFGGSFLLVKTVLDRFIYRKLKVIYKFIYQTKASRKEEMYYKYILPQKSIDEVSEDVEKWAIQRRNEIEELRSNETYRKEFLQNLAHEFKTPIFAIQGYVDTLLSGALENPAVNRKFLENASRNVDRMVALVSDLDEISSLESGEQPLNIRPFIIQDLIREVSESLSLQATERRITFAFKKGCEQPPLTVFADKERIRQVVINVLENALKYGKDGGHIVASVYRTDESRALIEISDDGIGIAEDHLPRVFERFYRTDTGRSRDVGGTGLGLAICKHIIEAHGQSIHIRSKREIGTTVGFTLATRAVETPMP